MIRSSFIVALLFGSSLAVLTTSRASENKIALEITPTTSRPQVSAGSNFGVTVDVRNKSDVPIYLSPKFFTMVLPPELDARAPYAWWAIFPGGQANDDVYSKVIKLMPGESVLAIWAGSRSYTVPGGALLNQWTAIRNELRLLTFQPGEYAIKILATYWTTEENVGKPLEESHNTTVEIKLPIVAPQWVIIFGAAIGGLIAYFLLPKFRLSPSKVSLAGISTAILLSVIVTILLSRIADTQFIVKVSINDIWGAIAIGFLGSASGTNIIKRWLPSELKEHRKA